MLLEDLIISGCVAKRQKLSNWERGFVDSIKSYKRKYGRLTSSQLRILIKMWKRIIKED